MTASTALAIAAKASVGASMTPLPKVDLYAPIDNEDRERYLTDMAEYTELKDHAYRLARELDARPNHYDRHGDFFEQLFFGNSTRFIETELKAIAEEFATRYGGDPDACGVGPEEVEAIRLRILSLVPLVPIARDHARFQIMAYLNQLPKFFASVANDRTDKVRFAVFTKWLQDHMPKFLLASVNPATNEPYFEDIHDFVHQAMMTYAECHDAGGCIRRHIETATASVSGMTLS